MQSQPTHRRHGFLAHAVIFVALLAVGLGIAAIYAPWEFTAGNLVLRSQRGMTHPFPRPDMEELVNASPRTKVIAEVETPPRNVILVIGDGMGVGQVSTASAMLHGPLGGLVMETAPVTGLMSTYAGNLLVTDSAASATALATGFKAPKKALSVLADGRVPVTLFEAARTRGLSTGLVTTSGLVDATPAGFTAHETTREHYPESLADMLVSGAELLIGGDWSNYEKALNNSEFQEMLGRIDALGEEAGFTVVRDDGELADTDGPVLALFPPRASGNNAHGPNLDRLVTFAADRLAANENGFVLLIESEVTDDTGHRNSVAEVVDAVRELDTAVASLLAWAEPRGDTLVVVTADHDTGGLGIINGDYSDGVAEVRWATNSHTAQWVPVFAFGPGAEHFTGVIDNTDMSVLFAKLLRIEDFPRLQP
jgi:alkaline phosphatase